MRRQNTNVVSVRTHVCSQSTMSTARITTRHVSLLCPPLGSLSLVSLSLVSLSCTSLPCTPLSRISLLRLSLLCLSPAPPSHTHTLGTPCHHILVILNRSSHYPFTSLAFGHQLHPHSKPGGLLLHAHEHTHTAPTCKCMCYALLLALLHMQKGVASMQA